MIAVDHQHHRLGILAQRVQQLAQKFIGFVQLIDVVFKLVFQAWVILQPRAGDRVGRLRRIAAVLAVPLHRNGKYQIALLSAAQRVQNAARQHLVAAPAQAVGGVVGHVFQAGKGIKAQHGVHLIALIEGGDMVVDGVGGIAHIAQIVGNRFAGFGFQDGAVWILARTEIAQVHARDHFKFHIGRAAANHGHMQKAGGAFFLQAGKDGHGVFRAGDAGDVGGIQKGLQLQKYEVGQLLCGGGGLCIPAHIGQDAVDHVFIVGFGSADATIHYAAAKAVGKARAVVARHGIGIITVVQGVDRRDRRRQAAQRGQQQQRWTAGRVQLGRAAEQNHHARNQRGNGQHNQRNLPPGDIGLRDGEIAYEDDEIIEVQRGNAHQADAAIHNGQHHPNRADQGIGEPAPLYQQSQGQRAGNQ